MLRTKLRGVLLLAGTMMALLVSGCASMAPYSISEAEIEDHLKLSLIHISEPTRPY